MAIEKLLLTVLGMCASLLVAPAAGHRMALPAPRAGSGRRDALLESGDGASSEASCRWHVAKCSCQALKGWDGKPEVRCVRWMTGMVNGKEACKSGDLSPADLDFSSSPHSPGTWAGKNWFDLLWMSGRDEANKAVKTMEDQCADPDLPVAFEGAAPAGSCTAYRLFKFALPDFMERGYDCARRKEVQARKLAKKLEGSKVLRSFDRRLTSSALMGCTAISTGCAEPTWTDSILQTVLDHLDTEFLGIGSAARLRLMEYAKETLMAEAGIDERTAKLLLDWAFYHKQGENAYCDERVMMEHRDMLVRGLTASEANHTVYKRPWRYGQDDVYKPFHYLLTMTIEGMFKADCKKDRPPEVDEARAREGVGLQILASEIEKAELDARVKSAVEQRDFLMAHKWQRELDAKTVAEPLLRFADIPLIGTTLEYMKSPVLQHPIEAVEADLVRNTLSTLSNLLSNETFVGHLKRNGGSFDGWEMPPELATLWAKTKSAKYGERIWPDSLAKKFRTPSEQKTHCECTEIEPNLALHMLNQLPDVGLDFGRVSLGSDGKLTSDKETETLQHIDLEGFAQTMIMVESGVQDPQLAAKYIIQKLLRGAEATGSKSAVPQVSSSGKVKGVLVGLPIVQSLWAVLEKEEGLATEVFAKKMKWFFVANIVWAVWHAIEANLPPEDIVLGLLTIALSTLSSFSYDGKWITFSNSKAFTDYMIAVYTVWNYRFVKQWASEEKPEDQWMHVSVALSMPIIEALANHGDITYYINYRRDDLFHAMLLMMERQQKEGKVADGRCCCDWDTEPSVWSRLTELPWKESIDYQHMANLQRCVIVPHGATKSSGKCPRVETARWVNVDAEKSKFMTWSSDKKFLQLHHDKAGCEDISKVLVLSQSAFR